MGWGMNLDGKVGFDLNGDGFTEFDTESKSSRVTQSETDTPAAPRPPVVEPIGWWANTGIEIKLFLAFATIILVAVGFALFV